MDNEERGDSLGGGRPGRECRLIPSCGKPRRRRRIRAGWRPRAAARRRYGVEGKDGRSETEIRVLREKRGWPVVQSTAMPAER